MHFFLQEFRFAAASLKRHPGFVFTVVITLGLTLGALVAAFSLNHLLFVKPLPYAEQERLHMVQGRRLKNGEVIFGNAISYSGLLDLYENGGVFEQAALLDGYERIITNAPSQPLVSVAYVSPQYFDLTEAPIALGRAFQDSEALGSQNAVAVLNHRLWQEEYSGRPDILDQNIVVDGVSYSVVGVVDDEFVEPAFIGPGQETQVWLQWDYNPTSEMLRTRWDGYLSFFFLGKLAPGVTAGQAEQRLSEQYNRNYHINATANITDEDHVDVRLRSLESVIVGDSRDTALLLFLGILTLVLIAATNITNLFLSRTAEKQHMMSIQAGLGATPRHLFLALLAENLLLMLLTMVVALLVAAGAITLLREYGATVIPRLSELTLSWPTVGFALLTALAMALIFSLVSASTIKYRQLNTGLQSGGKGSGLQISATVRNALIASQIALAALLVIANGQLFKQSLEQINQPLGFNSEQLTFMQLSYSGEALEEEERLALITRIRRELAFQPQIERVSSATTAPTTRANAARLTTDLGSDNVLFPKSRNIDEDYLPALQLPLIRGRNFSGDEVADASRNILVNETFARALSPEGDVVGERLYWPGQDTTDPYTVVGVVGDVTLPAEVDQERVYFTRNSRLNFMLRLAPGQRVERERMREMLTAIDPRLLIFRWQTMEDAHAELVSRDVLTAAVTLVLALLSLALAGIGIYGVLSYGIKLRRFEMGTRMALGAGPAQIIRLVLRDTLRPAAIGLMLSVLIGALLHALARQYVPVYSGVGMLPVLAALLLIALITVVASYLSARPVVSRPPIRALRVED